MTSCATTRMHPLERVRARFLLSWLLLSIVLSSAPLLFWPELVPGDASNQLPLAVWSLAFACLIVAVPGVRARRAGLDVSALYGALPSGRAWARLAVLALPTLGAAFVGVYVFYAPISLIWPDLAQWWLFEEQWQLYAAGPPFPWLGNLLSLTAVVVAAPVAEEWFFRGLLLRRWWHKWGPVTAVVASSLLFAIFHADLLGSFAFAVLMCALFARHRSLWAPTVVHATHNAVAWLLSVGAVHYPDAVDIATVEHLRAAWWLPVVGSVLVLPWALRFRKDYGPMSTWSFATSEPAAPTTG